MEEAQEGTISSTETLSADSEGTVSQEETAVPEKVVGKVKCKRMTAEEKKCLTNIVAKYKKYIENKHSDSVSLRKKSKAWVLITEEFNSSGHTTTYRTMEQLKQALKNSKTRTKTVISIQKIENKATGGGPFKAKLAADAAAVVALCPAQFEPLGGIPDSDTLHHGTPLKKGDTNFQQTSILLEIEDNMEQEVAVESQRCDIRESTGMTAGVRKNVLKRKKKTAPSATITSDNTLADIAYVWSDTTNIIQEITEPASAVPLSVDTADLDLFQYNYATETSDSLSNTQDASGILSTALVSSSQLYPPPTPTSVRNVQPQTSGSKKKPGDFRDALEVLLEHRRERIDQTSASQTARMNALTELRDERKRSADFQEAAYKEIKDAAQAVAKAAQDISNAVKIGEESKIKYYELKLKYLEESKK